MRIDLHTHTNRYSHCSSLAPRDLIRLSQQEGLNGIVLTEHNQLWTPEEVQELDDVIYSQDFIVLRGREVDIMDLHVLVYGYFDQIPHGIGIEKLKRDVHQQGGAIVIAHPFKWCFSPFRGRNREEAMEFLKNFDALEVFNSNCSDDEIINGLEIARKLNMRIVGASDAHSPKKVGTYCTLFSEKITSELELARALRKGSYRPDSCIVNNPLLNREIESRSAL